MVVEKPSLKSQELRLVQYSSETDTSQTLTALSPEASPVRRPSVVRGIAADFDHDAERFFSSVELEGRGFDLACNFLVRPEIKRSVPLDESLRISTIAASPDGQMVAMRFGKV